MGERRPQAYVILGLLMEGAKHGYDLHRSELLRIWSIPMSQLYNLLKRLEAQGMIRSSVHSQGNRPDKKVYHLTQQGREVLLRWTKHPTEKIRHIRTEFLAKLYLIHRLGLKTERDLIHAQLKVCRERRERFLQAPPPREPFEGLVLRYRLAMIDATIRWLKTCLPTLKGEQNVEKST